MGLFVEVDKPLDNREIVAGFVGQGSFTTQGDDGTDVSISPRLGVSFARAGGVTLFADWQGSFADDSAGHAVGLGLRLAF